MSLNDGFVFFPLMVVEMEEDECFSEPQTHSNNSVDGAFWLQPPENTMLPRKWF